MTDSREYRFPPVVKDPDETRSVVLSFYASCANFWRPNEIYDDGEYVRPAGKGNGYAFECTTPGTSSSREPVWPTVIGRTVTDGSVVWTCRAALNNGLSEISDPEATAPDGISVVTPLVGEYTNLLVDYTGGTLGASYDVKFTVTINGKLRVARQKVKVRAR